MPIILATNFLSNTWCFRVRRTLIDYALVVHLFELLLGHLFIILLGLFILTIASIVCLASNKKYKNRLAIDA